ncbi:hypothetical protein DB88DRAFT_484774 [Papiliotrema laurentii]|uniref:RING-type domain-containing protein n=1 Tax=Papiliotrema laurentii TaxID=5418 RepID=A0AAD9FTB8_PAPLA|nr:hypothetical protein DB88DRAFT_484774 [Papiliotrema laurentii]
MSTTLSNTSWYTQSYGGPFRSNRLRAPSLLPGSRSVAVVPVQQTLVVDAQRPANTNNGTAEEEHDKNIRRRETIFGPDVGEDDEPGWTKPDEGAKIDVNVVKGWVERAKSEEGIHATTVLQALVNLKRPTLLLQQLELQHPEVFDKQDEEDISAASTSRPTSMVPTPPLHSLKFNYDAMTPLVNISLSIYPTPPPVIVDENGKEAPSIVEQEPKTVYSGVHGGGFNQTFQLPAEAALDLSSAITPMSPASNDSAVALSGEDEKLNGPGGRDTQSEDTHRSSVDRAMGNLNIAQPDLATVPELQQTPAEHAEDRRPRRFGIFPRRGHRESDPEQGQIELQNRTQEAHEAEKEKPKEPEMGLRLLIRIEAVGPEGQALKRRNAQLTHILITGMWVPDAGSTAPPGQNGKRVWIVKVVRREAVIGAHTFLLKEIYGLSSSTQSQPASYPPGESDPYASTPNECIVCLTSPRDVVLLPCRHLVVCRECAVGMVEFGAGGKVARREEGNTNVETEASATNGTATQTGGSSNNATAVPVAGGTTATGRERRKKKAKGWYCPVCRQPYTSLLRLALPASAKPLRTPAASRLQSRAPSIRSVHSTYSLRRPPSIAPTLPDGAEEMLDRLRPHGADDDDDEGVDDRELERPQFVLGNEVDGDDDKDKVDVEHREHAESSSSMRSDERPRPSHEAPRPNGWREV